MQAAYKYYLTFKSMLLFVVVLIKENSFLGSLCKQAAAAGIGIVAALEQPSEWFPAFQLPLETGRGGALGLPWPCSTALCLDIRAAGEVAE